MVLEQLTDYFPYDSKRTSFASCIPRRRLVKKNGKPNVIRSHIPQLWTAYIRDLGNTLVNSRWRWTIICFASSYLVSWLLFAWFYMLIARDNGDISPTNSSETPCLIGIEGFTGYFLFSLETQHTIGYGTRFITSNCPEGTFLISLQMIMGVAICGGMASIVYTKMVRPHAAHSKTLFSKTAVICQRDGILCLIFRVRDEDYRHRVGTKINAYLVQRRAQEPFLKSLLLERPGFLLWPLEVVHKITPSSPFWDLSAKDLITKRFELIVTLQGVSVTTGQCSKTRTSFLASEILWGHRFKACVKFDSEKHSYYVDNTDFNTTEEVLTPLCSAQRLYEVIQEFNSTGCTPILTKSPTTSRSWNLPPDDFDYPGELASVADDFWHLSPASCKKLCITRKDGQNAKESPLEVNALIAPPDSNLSVSVSSVDEASRRSKEDLRKDPKQIEEGKRNSGAVQVDDLVASLQNYLLQMENESKDGCKTFCETTF